ncbi:hypothetical protein F5148DRAFT_1153309 [Russula earlei]|uniref:Uncharacterized protein n=1 Tax=Russula earlei TaxID=71964 RepID=A0ACC0TTZ3_9AGAM|nr:hypothetical protein F5148DRAFT_1153309 [Russula earlei]
MAWPDWVSRTELSLACVGLCTVPMYVWVYGTCIMGPVPIPFTDRCRDYTVWVWDGYYPLRPLYSFCSMQDYLHVMMIGGSSEDASYIVWFNDKDDDTPITSTSTVQTGSSAQNQRTWNTAWMQEIIEAEQASSESDLHPWPHRRKYNKCRREVLSVPEDMPYASTMSLGSSSESDNTITEITHDEVL